MWDEFVFQEVDEHLCASLVQMVLREYGHLPCRCHIVPDGEAALAFLRHEGFYAGMPRPDLIILDIGLPKLGGWQVLKALRTTPALARMPVVILTGARMETDEVQRERFQPLPYFVKPLFLREYLPLVEQLEQLLEGEAALGSREADVQERDKRPHVERARTASSTC